MTRKFSYKIPGMTIMLMAASFALAFLDMTMLKNSISTVIAGTTPKNAAILAFAIATMANLFALDWGRENGRNESKKKINKESRIGFAGWLLFGSIYVLLKSIDLCDADISNLSELLGKIGEFILLASSYIFSGLSIEAGASEVWNVDASSCRKSESEFTEKVKLIANEDPKIDKMLSSLENYNQNYDTLDAQYQKQLDAIRHAEDSVINEILGKTLQANPEITPSDAQEVVEQAKKDSK